MNNSEDKKIEVPIFLTSLVPLKDYYEETGLLYQRLGRYLNSKEGLKCFDELDSINKEWLKRGKESRTFSRYEEEITKKYAKSIEGCGVDELKGAYKDYIDNRLIDVVPEDFKEGLERIMNIITLFYGLFYQKR